MDGLHVNGVMMLKPIQGLLTFPCFSLFLLMILKLQ